VEEIKMALRYRVRLMFEWGGGCLWCGNDNARQRFGVGPIEDRLHLTPATRQGLLELTQWHDQALNWTYPPDPGPWTPQEYERFDIAATDMMTQLGAELGPDFDVVYERL
jgi:hypothetical protein